MSRDAESGELARFAQRGSQRWLQIAVEKHSDVLLEALRAQVGLADGDSIDWRSPRQGTDFKEYRDGEALRQAGIGSLKLRPLKKFWPARGPVWDAIGIAGDKSIFVEAKAHIPEMASTGTKASPDSVKLIKQSLVRTGVRVHLPRQAHRNGGEGRGARR